MITDPIADMLARINNAIKARKDEVSVPSSKIKVAIADILKREGYIEDYVVSEENKKGTQGTLIIKLKYLGKRNTKPAIAGVKRVSKPGRRIYSPVEEIPYVQKGLGLAILSTNKGIITDHEARKLKVGGEILCYVW
ncbi:30S ribosomal protein S8 [Venenivibrio stagnispumantis]|uniref:Small ribosomal subunit protein uS8 n=1 Tax=Venenivibrio stagnispumantis TaxID=407998 RepID=A0AA45WLF4_9AQUI|nr:30S ribosomal protein S8 [Venenivibrio stagnispumantis]MCW4573303.1 30S ribosomal protein S8 [Venenivibrio stagnispumantis]SMP11119.1 small subunit ribosomal protein S8 [Venenivibrio stagnispumantis]